MTEIIECTTKETPSHVVLNSYLLRNNKGYTTLEESKEEANIEGIIWGKENISLVKFKDIENPVLIDELINGGVKDKGNSKTKGL